MNMDVLLAISLVILLFIVWSYPFKKIKELVKNKLVCQLVAIFTFALVLIIAMQLPDNDYGFRVMCFLCAPLAAWLTSGIASMIADSAV